jgi:hypothetical protein
MPVFLCYTTPKTRNFMIKEYCHHLPPTIIFDPHEYKFEGIIQNPGDPTPTIGVFLIRNVNNQTYFIVQDGIFEDRWKARKRIGEGQIGRDGENMKNFLKENNITSYFIAKRTPNDGPEDFFQNKLPFT